MNLADGGQRPAKRTVARRRRKHARAAAVRVARPSAKTQWSNPVLCASAVRLLMHVYSAGISPIGTTESNGRSWPNGRAGMAAHKRLQTQVAVTGVRGWAKAYSRAQFATAENENGGHGSFEWMAGVDGFAWPCNRFLSRHNLKRRLPITGISDALLVTVRMIRQNRVTSGMIVKQKQSRY